MGAQFLLERIKCFRVRWLPNFVNILKSLSYTFYKGEFYGMQITSQ